MPHWEVQEFIKGYYEHRAKNLLALTDAIMLGSGMMGDEKEKRKLANNLLEQSGYKRKQRERRKRRDFSKMKGKPSWTKDLINFAKRGGPG